MALMNALPVKAQCQAGGIVTSARLLGGIIGVAVGSTLLATTGSFQVVFLVPSGLLLAALVLAGSPSSISTVRALCPRQGSILDSGP